MITLFLCFFFLLNSDFLPNADLYQVIYVSRGKILVKGKPAFVGQTFNSEKEVQFSNCVTEKLIAKNLQNSQQFGMGGNCVNIRNVIGINSVFFKIKVGTQKDLEPQELLKYTWEKLPLDAPELKKIQENSNIYIRRN